MSDQLTYSVLVSISCIHQITRPTDELSLAASQKQGRGECYNHCAKSSVFGSEFARIRNGTRHVYRNVRAYSMTRDSKYTWNILLESGMFFRIQIEYSRMT